MGGLLQGGRLLREGSGREGGAYCNSEGELRMVDEAAGRLRADGGELA